MYVLTRCPVCNTEIMATGGCCGEPMIKVYKCPCGQKALEELEDGSKREG